MPAVLLLLLIILAELLLRFGFWDDQVEPHSYLGNAIYREKAIKAFGLDNIEWITVGDSKMDWGIEHEKFFKMSQYNGINHLRMSFEGSEFMAIQSVIEWSIKNMPNLKGIMLGVTENNFGHFNDVDKQHKILGPFSSHKNDKKYAYYKDGLRLERVLNSFYAYKYFADFKDFLKNYRKRIKKINHYLTYEHENIFTYSRQASGNICQYKLDTLQNCVDEATQIREKAGILQAADEVILLVCDNDYARNRAKKKLSFWSLSDQKMRALSNNWQQLFDTILSHDIKLKVVLLPDHSIMNYSVKPTNTSKVMNKVLGDIVGRINVDVLDLRRILISKDGQKECDFYYEPFHYNNKGKALITERIIESFNFMNKHEINKDLINQFDFQ